MKIYYVRHGEPKYDEFDSLTENGVYQVNEISKFLSTIPFRLAFTSPIKRTVTSAEPTLKKLGIKSTPLEFASEDFAWYRLNGANENGEYKWLFVLPFYKNIFKEYVNKTNKEFFKDKEIKKTNFKLIQKRVDKGVDRWLKTLGIIHNRKKKTYICKNVIEKEVILFAHQGISTFIFSSLLDEAYPKFVLEHELLDCASITIFDINEKTGKIVLKVYNDIKY